MERHARTVESRRRRSRNLLIGWGEGAGQAALGNLPEEVTMAKGQKRSGREPKKPKKEKPKAAVASSPFVAVRTKPAMSMPESKK
jgi:hypothetical protein